jgi:hypothetical protein
MSTPRHDVIRPIDHSVPSLQTGVDVTLIDWMLGLSPEDRLRVLQDQVELIASARRASAD